MAWIYQPDQQPKRKHHWKHPYPGFAEYRGLVVGKCPSDMSQQTAERLLNRGIPWSGRGWQDDWPQRIYVVHEGAVYRAVPTVPGISYHAFPERGRDLRALPEDVRERIRARARELNCEEEVRRWINR